MLQGALQNLEILVSHEVSLEVQNLKLAIWIDQISSQLEIKFLSEPRVVAEVELLYSRNLEAVQDLSCSIIGYFCVPHIYSGCLLRRL